MSSVNSTKSYILLFANFDSLSNMAIFYQFRGISYSQIDAFPTLTHTHTQKKIQKQWLVIFPFCSGYNRFFFWVRRCLQKVSLSSSWFFVFDRLRGTSYLVVRLRFWSISGNSFTSSGFSVFDWVTGISFSTSWFIAFREFEYLVPYKLECFLLKSLLLSASFQNNQNLTYLVMECIFFSGIFSGRRSLVPRDSW